MPTVRPPRRRHDRERQDLPPGGEREELVDERRHLTARSARTDPQVLPDVGVAAGPSEPIDVVSCERDELDEPSGEHERFSEPRGGHAPGPVGRA